MTKQDPMEEQLVQLTIPLNGHLTTKKEFDQYTKLEDDLEAAITKAGVGALDGNEIGQHEYTILMYGRDATKLAGEVKAVLKGRTLPKECSLLLRHGGVIDTTSKEETIEIDN